MSLPSGLILEISVDCDAWQKSLPNYQDITLTAVSQVIENVLEGKAIEKFSHIELSIVLCDDTLIHELNNDFREKDKATNVLSFTGLDQDELKAYLIDGEEIPDHPHSLGEIYIAYQTMNKEAKDANVSLSEHFTHLLIHGLLHLIGYDHMDDDEAEEMETLETKLLANLSIDDPYAP